MATLGQLEQQNRGDGERMTVREGPDRPPVTPAPPVPATAKALR